MTKQDAKQYFIETLGMDQVNYWRKHDKPALREQWNNFVDALCRDKSITEKQASTWINPFFGENQTRMLLIYTIQIIEHDLIHLC